MVEASKKVEEWTNGAIPSMDKWLNGIVDLHTKAADAITEALGGMTSAQEEASNRFIKDMNALGEKSDRVSRTMAGLQGHLEEGSLGAIQFSKSLDKLSEDELTGIAKGMAGKLKKGGESEDDATKRILENLKKAQAMKTPAAGAEFSAFQKAAEKDKSLTYDRWKATPQAAESMTAENLTGGKGKGAASGKGSPQNPPVVAVTRLTDEQKKAVSVQVATDLSPQVKGMASSLFDGMSKQATEYNAAQMQAGAAYWTDMVKSGKAAWDDITKQWQKSMGGTSMISLTPEGQAAGKPGEKGKGKGKQGPSMGVGASVGPDGTIHINFSIPRNLLDKSNRQTANSTE
jgi:hypothetical protein